MGSTLTNKLYIFEISSVLFCAGCTVALSTTYHLPKEGFIKEYAKEAHALYVTLQVVDLLWPMKLHNYSCSCSSYDFSLVWAAFVRENALPVGDVWKTHVNKMKWYTFFYMYISTRSRYYGV